MLESKRSIVWCEKKGDIKPGAASAVVKISGSYMPPRHAIRNWFVVVTNPDLPETKRIN